MKHLPVTVAVLSFLVFLAVLFVTYVPSRYGHDVQLSAAVADLQTCGRLANLSREMVLNREHGLSRSQAQVRALAELNDAHAVSDDMRPRDAVLVNFALDNVYGSRMAGNSPTNVASLVWQACETDKWPQQIELMLKAQASSSPRSRHRRTRREG